MSNKRKKVLHITLTSSCGGGPEHVYQLTKNISSEWTSYIAAPFSDLYYPLFRSVVGDERMVEVPCRKLSLKAFIELVRFVIRHDIDVIHSHGKGAGIYGRCLALVTRRKSVHTFHGLHLQHRFVLLLLYKAIERLLCSVTDAVICVSKGEVELASNLRFTRIDRYHLIENGVDCSGEMSRFDRKKPFVIVHMSRFDFAKNSEALIPIALELDRLGILRDSIFCILGAGDGMEVCKKKVREHGLEDVFKFEGIRSNPRAFLRGEAKEVLGSRAGCYLSTSRWEGLPLSVLEAMSEGVPVVASDVIGNRDAVVHGKTGFLFTLENPRSAADYISELHDQELRNKLSSAARDRIAGRFSVNQMADKTVHVYNVVFNCGEPAHGNFYLDQYPLN